MSVQGIGVRGQGSLTTVGRVGEGLAAAQSNTAGDCAGDEEVETRGSEHDREDDEDLGVLVNVDEKRSSDRQEHGAHQGVVERRVTGHGVGLVAHGVRMSGQQALGSERLALCGRNNGLVRSPISA